MRGTTPVSTAQRVAYDLLDSPVGPLFAAVSERGICRLAFDPDLARTVAELEAHTEGEVRRYPEDLLEVRYQLAGYFAGERRAFALDVDLRFVTDFARRVLEACARIPYGAVRTYADLAATVGNPSGARAVGQALNRNPVAVVVPCHRVVGASGDLTGFGGGLERKAILLSLEGAWDASTPGASPN